MNIHNKYWKIMTLLSLCIFLSSCGGGSGGGGSSSGNNNTNNITPPSQNVTMDFKKSDTIIGVIDSSFSYLDEFKDPSGKYRIFIDDSFPTDPEERKAKSYTHGELVSLLIGGNKTGVTDGVKIYAIPSFLAYSDQIKVQGSMYQKMYQAGVRIFSQSFGSPTNDLTSEKFPASSSLVNFYVSRSSTDSLFIFAAGNNGKSNPAAEALFPKLYPRAEKGWISVVGINPKTGLIDSESNRAGDAKNWTIAANYEVTVEKISGVNVYSTTAYGTSFAAPVVAGAAGAIQLKYPWMSRDLIKQSLLTTATDLGAAGVDDIYGWGLLNLEKAMKGPAAFDKRLTFDEHGYRSNDVIIDMEGHPTSSNDIDSYTFSNNISGNAGVIKKGSGTLWFTGYNTYSGQTTIQEGVLTVTNHLNSDVVIEKNGTMRAVGLISPLGTSERTVTVNGNIKNTSSSLEGLSISRGGLKINGNYTGNTLSSISIDITSALKVTGSSIKVDVVEAMFMSIGLSMLIEGIRRKAFKSTLAELKIVFTAMGSQFANVITLIVAGEFFALGLTKIGVISALIDSTKSAGLGPQPMILVMTAIIAISSILMGSGNAPFFAFAALAPAVAASVDLNPIVMLMPMQLAAGIARSISPITAVIVAVAGISGVSPFDVVKRTAAPMIGGLLAVLITNMILFG